MENDKFVESSGDGLRVRFETSFISALKNRIQESQSDEPASRPWQGFWAKWRTTHMNGHHPPSAPINQRFGPT